jgi:hypothetical protein
MAALGLLALLLACSGEASTSDGGGGGDGAVRLDAPGGGTDGPGGGTDGPGGGTDGPGGGTDGPVTGDTQCSNGIDDDGDGLVDGMDPECTLAADDDESSFATGIPGDNRDPMWQDCFFDGNSGAGDDGCRYRTGCLTGDLPPTDPDCELSAECIEFCAPRTPNGCDCFGCCEVTLGDGSTRLIRTGAGCSLADIDSCESCVQTADCVNECGTCELCPGRTADDLPPECYDDPDGGMPMYMCDDGVTCMGDSDCPGGYCSLGCCLSGPF